MNDFRAPFILIRADNWDKIVKSPGLSSDDVRTIADLKRCFAGDSSLDGFLRKDGQVWADMPYGGRRLHFRILLMPQPGGVRLQSCGLGLFYASDFSMRFGGLGDLAAAVDERLRNKPSMNKELDEEAERGLRLTAPDPMPPRGCGDWRSLAGQDIQDSREAVYKRLNEACVFGEVEWQDQLAIQFNLPKALPNIHIAACFSTPGGLPRRRSPGDPALEGLPTPGGLPGRHQQPRAGNGKSSRHNTGENMRKLVLIVLIVVTHAIAVAISAKATEWYHSRKLETQLDEKDKVIADLRDTNREQAAEHKMLLDEKDKVIADLRGENSLLQAQAAQVLPPQLHNRYNQVVGVLERMKTLLEQTRGQMEEVAKELEETVGRPESRPIVDGTTTRQ